MPYSGPNDASLPSNVKSQPEAKRAEWVAIFNRIYAKYGETAAFRWANGSVKKQVDDSDVLVVPDYVSVVGSAVRNIEGSTSLDIIVRDSDEVPQVYKDELFATVQKAFEGKELRVVYNSDGPADQKFLSVYDLVHRPGANERILVKAAGLRMQLVGSSGVRSEGLVVEYHGARVLIDGGVSAPDGEVDAWLRTEPTETTEELQAVAMSHGVRAYSGDFHRGGPDGGLTVMAHVDGLGYGFEIVAGGKRVAWVPKATTLPVWANGADLVFVARDISKEARAAEVRKIVELGYAIPGTSYVVRRGGMARAFQRMAKSLTDEQRAEVEAETTKIKERRAVYGRKRHAFKAAKWTHPNGHPRCALCMQEQRTGGYCDALAKDALTTGDVPTTIEQPKRTEQIWKQRFDVGYEVIKSAGDKQYTFGVMYKATNDRRNPVEDAHREWATADELQGAQWDYVRSGDRSIQLQHGIMGFMKIGEWVDIVAWPKEETVTLTVPGEAPVETTIPANSVWMGVLWNDDGWKLVQQGKIRGFSMGGMARRRRGNQVVAKLDNMTEKMSRRQLRASGLIR
jgi:hypothetical protein